MHDYPQTIRLKSKRIGVFERSLLGEFLQNGVMVASILLGILITNLLIRLLGDAAGGRLPVDGVFALLCFASVNYLPVLLSLSLFISILLTLSRAYRDSEMVVWHCAGIGLTYWIRPVLLYAIPVITLISLLSLGLSPWAVSKSEELKRQLENRDDVASATTGVFRESKQAERVYFIESANALSNRVSNVFVHSQRNGKQNIMFARQGFQETLPNGDRFLVLLNGTSYEGIPGQQDYNMVEFARYAVRIDHTPPKDEAPSVRALSTLELIQQPTLWNASEFCWRLGAPMSALVLALLAIPLSFVNPRAGRSFNLIVAIVLYMVYNNLMSVSTAWVGQGRLHPVLAILGLHLSMLLIVAGLFYKRMLIVSKHRWLTKWRKGGGV